MNLWILFKIYIIFIIFSYLIRKYIQLNLRYILLEVIRYLNDNKINYWVDFGTLLGLHREKDIIMGDMDCDICIWKTEEDHIRFFLVNFCQNKDNFTFKEYDWGVFRIYYNKFRFMDIYKAKISPDNPEEVMIPDSKNTPINLLRDFETVELPFHRSTIQIRQPVKWEDMLEFRYTKNWTKPMRKWWLGYFVL